MRFDLTIYADGLTELRSALEHIAGAVRDDVFTINQPWSIVATPVSDTDKLVAAMTPSAVADQMESTGHSEAPAPVPAPNKRGRKPAAAKVEAGSEPDCEPEPEQDAPVDQSPADARTEALGLLGQSPADARTEALGLLGQIYGQDNGPATLIKLREKFGVEKFGEVPPERGHELLSEARKALKVAA